MPDYSQKLSLLSLWSKCLLPSAVRRLCKLLNERRRYGADGVLKALTFSSVICAKYTITPAFKTDYVSCLRGFSMDILISSCLGRCQEEPWHMIVYLFFKFMLRTALWSRDCAEAYNLRDGGVLLRRLANKY